MGGCHDVIQSQCMPDSGWNSWPIIVAEYGSFYQSGGTSASAPIFATFVAAINDARLAANKTTIGWINPAVRCSQEYPRWQFLTSVLASSSTLPTSMMHSTT